MKNTVSHTTPPTISPTATEGTVCINIVPPYIDNTASHVKIIIVRFLYLFIIFFLPFFGGGHCPAALLLSFFKIHTKRKIFKKLYNDFTVMYLFKKQTFINRFKFVKSSKIKSSISFIFNSLSFVVYGFPNHVINLNIFFRNSPC